MGANAAMTAEKVPGGLPAIPDPPEDPAEKAAVRNNPMRPIQIMMEATDPARSMSSNVVLTSLLVDQQFHRSSSRRT